MTGDQWQPIETAPRDGSRFLAYAIEEADDMMPQIARWELIEQRFVLSWDGTAFGDPSVMPDPLTHWMPLPAPPQEPDND